MHFSNKIILQVRCIKLHITHFLQNHSLHLVAVLLLLVPALLHWLVHALQAVLHVTERLERLLLALVTDLPGLLLAVLGVAVLLGLLRASLHLQLTDLLWLKVAILLFHGEGEDIGKLLTIPVDISLAHLNLDLSGDVVTILFRLPGADNALGSIAIVLSTLVPLAAELHGVGAGHVVDHLLLHVAIWRLEVSTLVVILGGHVYSVSGVTDSILACEASLDLVGLFQGLVMNSLHQVTNQFVHIEANTLNTCLNNTSAVLVLLWSTFLVILGPAGGLCVWLTLVLENYLLHHVAIGVLVDAVPSNVGLANIRLIALNRSRSWIFRRRRWSTGDKCDEEEYISLNHAACCVASTS